MKANAFSINLYLTLLSGNYTNQEKSLYHTRAKQVLLDEQEKAKSAKTLRPCARCPTQRKAAGTSPPKPKPERSKLLRCTPQFSQLINAALFAPHPPKENQPTLPGVLPGKGRGKGV
jgi:hypothetical protein